MGAEEEVRNYAHQLWEKAGRPRGRDAEFWYAAEAELNAESENPDPGSQPAPCMSSPADGAGDMTAAHESAKAEKQEG